MDLVCRIVTRMLPEYLSFAEGFAWRLVRKANNAWWLTMREANMLPIQHQIAVGWMRHRWTKAGMPNPERFLQAMVEHKTVTIGSDPLAAILSATSWTPGDLDLFGMCQPREGKGKDPGPTDIRDDELYHYTPFVHDAFGFTFPFLRDEEMPREADDIVRHLGDRLRERLECVTERDGYELLPVWRRRYRWLTSPIVEAERSVGLATHEHENADEVTRLGDACSLIFDYNLVLRGVAPHGCRSLMDLFNTPQELPFRNVMFDGHRFRVQDWDSVWTQSAVVVGGPAMHPSDDADVRMRKWKKLLDSVGKYRGRRFRVDLVNLDTTFLLQPNQAVVNMEAHAVRDGRMDPRPRRRHSWSVRVPETTKIPWMSVYMRDGLLRSDTPSASWRPTYALRKAQADKERKKREEERARPWDGGWGVIASRPIPWGRTKTPGSAPSTPRARHARLELWRKSFTGHLSNELDRACRRVAAMGSSTPEDVDGDE